MQVITIEPYGYCSGVLLALKKAYEAKKSKKQSNVFLLGMLVHNEETIALLKKAGLLLLDERKLDLKEALSNLKEGDTVIFSAHGHPKEYEAIAKKNHVEFIDATCPFVKANEEEAKQLLSEGKEIVYLGVKGHLESEGFRANIKEAAFFDVHSLFFEKEKIKGSSIVLLCQTTLSEEEIDASIAYLKGSFSNIEQGKLRCHSTSSRQQALKDLDSSVQAVLVLGSETSNNSLKLYELALSKKKKAFLCLGLEEVKKLDLKSFSKVALCSGASTSQETFLAVKEYLLSL